MKSGGNALATISSEKNRISQHSFGLRRVEGEWKRVILLASTRNWKNKLKRVKKIYSKRSKWNIFLRKYLRGNVIWQTFLQRLQADNGIGKWVYIQTAYTPTHNTACVLLPWMWALSWQLQEGGEKRTIQIIKCKFGKKAKTTKMHDDNFKYEIWLDKVTVDKWKAMMMQTQQQQV